MASACVHFPEGGNIADWERQLMECECPHEEEASGGAARTPVVPVAPPKIIQVRQPVRPVPSVSGWLAVPGTNPDSSTTRWEDFDATALFDETPRLHVNKVTKVDKQDTTKVEEPSDSPDAGQTGNPDDNQNEEDISGTYGEESPGGGHTDELLEMEGGGSSTVDSPEIKADTTDDQRTDEPSEDAGEADDGTGEAEAEKSVEDNPGESVSGSLPAPCDSSPESEASAEDDGAEKPKQKESEGVDEVAKATSKTSEDVHGGDEATKDIKDSPNAADDGQNLENHGAEAGVGDEDGEGSEGSGDLPGETTGEAGEDAAEPFGNAESPASGYLDAEDWEAAVDATVATLELLDSFDEIKAKERQDEAGHRTGLPTYQFDRDVSLVELEIAFLKGRELIERLANEQDYTSRVMGQARWDAGQIVRNVVTYRHTQIPEAKYDRPREADIVMLLDISGSCAQQAEMFMAIAAGAIGNGVRIYVGYNGSARCRPLEPPRRPLRTYAQAKAWVQAEVEQTSGWHNAGLGEWGFGEFVKEVQPKTCIIFGDWDGIDQYQLVCHLPAHRRTTKFYWFANEGIGRRAKRAGQIPERWTSQNYFPSVFRPQDLVVSLRKVR